MKKALYTLGFLFFTLGSTFAQADTLSASEYTVHGSAVLDDLSTSPDDISAHVDLVNNANEAKNFTWQRTILNLPSGWRVAVCDVNFCYDPSVSSEQFLQSAGSTAEMIVHAYPGGQPGANVENATLGTAEVQIQVFENGNPDNEETIVYLLTLDATTGTVDIQRNDLKVYPNPTDNLFRISDNDLVKNIQVMNVVGQKVFTSPIQNGEYLSVAHLRKGMYLVQMMDEKNQIIKTVRLLKN